MYFNYKNQKKKLHNIQFHIKGYGVSYYTLILFFLLSVYIVSLCALFIVHDSEYGIVIHSYLFEWSQLIDTFYLLYILTLRYLGMISWYMHVLFLLFCIIIYFLDYRLSVILIIWYLGLCLLLGCHYDITNLITLGQIYYIDLGYLQIEFLYSETVLQQEAFNYFSELNSQWGTNFNLDSEFLSDWIKLSLGRKSVLRAKVANYWTVRYLLKNFSIVNSRIKRKKKKSSSGFTFYDFIVRLFTGKKK